MYITIILTVVVVGIVMVFMSIDSDMSVSSFEEVVLVTNGLSESISNFFILIKPSMNILLNYDNLTGLWNFAIYIVESFITYYVLLLIMSKIYLKGAMRNYN